MSCSALQMASLCARAWCVVHAVQVQQQPADGVGRAAAVVEQFGAVGVGAAVARLLDVLHEGAQQVGQQVFGQGVLRDGVGERAEHVRPARDRAALALRGGCELFAVGAQFGQAFVGRGVAFVGDVVRGAGEVVDRGDGRAQVRRAQPRGDRKVLVVRRRRRQGGGEWRTRHDCPPRRQARALCSQRRHYELPAS
jgi:hypothetical protein